MTINEENREVYENGDHLFQGAIPAPAWTD